MLDFLMISTRSKQRGVVEIYPKFIIKKSSDLMIRGGDFYAIWLEDKGSWSTEEQDAIQAIDRELDKFAEENKHKFDSLTKVLHLWDAESGMIDNWHKYCQKQMRDNFHMLDEKLVFMNDICNKKDYSSKRLNYSLEKGTYDAYDKLISTLYSEDERHKIEWAIGSIITGDSKKLQKFMVLYGDPGSGKGTILDIILSLFDGYCATFDAKALGQSSNSFALEPFKANPLVAIQHDGNLSKIEDNTRLNSLVSHEIMTVNEKFKSAYSNKFKAFLFVGTNNPVKITDAKSGLLRRLIDVSPSGNKIPQNEYKRLVKSISFELGAIAYHCREVYLDNPGAYDDYIPLNMMGASNDFYNFVLDSYFIFKSEDGITLKRAYDMYKTYCEDAKVPYPLSRMIFKEELKNYFKNYKDRETLEDGTRVRSYYMGFRADKFMNEESKPKKQDKKDSLIEFKIQKSYFDDFCKDCLAQYATDGETPSYKWENVTTTLKGLSTDKLHYVKVPENHIVIDFDIPDEDGNKSFEKNLEAASKWPATYAELSKSGEGIHLHYIYNGDASKLSRIYDDHIEVKVFTGKSSLRRKLTKCNDLPIATISSGLKLKGEKMIDIQSIKSVRSLRQLIERNLNKEIHAGTKPSIDFIYKILEDAYNGGMSYDVRDMQNSVYMFAAHSTHHKDYCMKLVDDMKFCSEDVINAIFEDESKPIVFYDIEVFPNLLLVNYKLKGKEHITRLINPSSEELEKMLKYRLIGFNCRRYDNHIIYARIQGYNNEQCYKLSKRIISQDKEAFFQEAYNLSYTDIYDFASAGNKKSLKKLEIEMGIHHQELGLDWDKPVPEELWPKVSAYCDNDVIATEKAFDYLEADWTARQILSDLAGMSVNDTTNTLTTRIIFKNNRKPQNEFYYRDLSKPVKELDSDILKFLKEACPDMMSTKHGDGSLLPYFPGYTFDPKTRTSIYKGEEVGEGGYVYSEPGMYGNVALLDVASMHPHSTIAECHFGVKYTSAYRDIVEGRVSIKHEAWDVVDSMLDGKLRPYIQKVKDGVMSSKKLADALKTAINAVYGLTSATFSNPFKDPRNLDNIVAKRGALFMIDLKYEVQKRGFTVAHIKTDSIKIPDATPEIITFVMEFGKKYGYTFEHEATYDRMCLVNNAVYIAKYKSADECKKMYGYIPGDNSKKENKWTATGTEFAVSYVFKKLFSKEDIVFEDLCETFSVSKGDLYLDMNEDLVDVTLLEKQLSKLEKDFKAGKIPEEEFLETKANLETDISRGHQLQFIGRVGQFTPINKGYGGGVLYRVVDGKCYAATGSSGYRWLESENVKEKLSKVIDNAVDKSYYEKLVTEAIEHISKYGDFDWFVSDEPYISKWSPNVPKDIDDEVPFIEDEKIA